MLFLLSRLTRVQADSWPNLYTHLLWLARKVLKIVCTVFRFRFFSLNHDVAFNFFRCCSDRWGRRGLEVQRWRWCFGGENQYCYMFWWKQFFLLIYGPASQANHSENHASHASQNESHASYSFSMKKICNKNMQNRKWRSKSLQRNRCRQWSQPVGGSCLTEVARAWSGQCRGNQFDSSKLRDDRIRQVFRWELKNHFQILGEEQELNINSFNQTFKEVGEKVLGFNKRKKEEWIQEETWEKIETRRGVKQRRNSTQSMRPWAAEEKILKTGPWGEKNDQTRQKKIFRGTGGWGRRGCW